MHTVGLQLKTQGERFRQLREALGFSTQEEFGIALGKRVNSDGSPIDKGTISRYENGKAAVAKKVLIELFSSFFVSRDWWDTGSGGMFSEEKSVSKHQWQDTSELAIKEEHLTGRSFEDIISRYKHDLTNPPMVKDEIVAYRTIVNSHSTPDILINVLYRLDNLEGK